MSSFDDRSPASRLRNGAVLRFIQLSLLPILERAAVSQDPGDFAVGRHARNNARSTTCGIEAVVLSESELRADLATRLDLIGEVRAGDLKAPDPNRYLHRTESC